MSFSNNFKTKNLSEVWMRLVKFNNDKMIIIRVYTLLFENEQTKKSHR